MQNPPSPQMIFGWLYPKKCVGCQSWGKYFCDSCLKRVRVDEVWRCPECSKASIGGVRHLYCKESDELDGLVSFLPYRGVIGAGVRSLKYRFLKKIEEDLYKIFVGAVRGKLKGGQAKGLIDFLKIKPVVVPVPLYWRKHNFRGFNQAEIVGEMTAKLFGLEINDVFLVRRKETKPQAKLNKSERVANLKLAFGVRKSKKIDNVLLVDDVWTTGETMRSASKTLKEAGVKKVWGLTLAR